MPSNLNTYGDISPRTAAFAAKELLRRGQPHAILEKFGYFDPQGTKKTKTRTWRRYEPLAAADAPLVEGQTPQGQKLRKTDVEVTLKQYGDFVELTDAILDTHEDEVLNESLDLCSQQIVETTELIRFAALKAGTNVYYANSVASRLLVNSAPLRGDLRRIYRGFKRYRAMEITEIIKAGMDVSTEPVKKSFVVVGHTDLDADIRLLTGFTPTEKYASQKVLDESEIGSCENFRFCLTDLFAPWLAAATSISSGQTTFLSNGLASAGYPDVYPLLAFGKYAYAIVPLAGKNVVKPMVKNPEPTVGDELGQRGFVSWKMWQACAILQDTWMARYEVCATASPN